MLQNDGSGTDDVFGLSLYPPAAERGTNSRPAPFKLQLLIVCHFLLPVKLIREHLWIG